MTDTPERIPADMRDRAQLWRYMQHQEEVQHERLSRGRNGSPDTGETVYHIEYHHGGDPGSTGTR
jgi:hypothetical protein